VGVGEGGHIAPGGGGGEVLYRTAP
jgi:hypothetical protein